MYDIRLKDGKVSFILDGYPPTHFVDCDEALAILERTGEGLLSERRHIAEAFHNIRIADIHLKIALRRDDETH